MTDTKPTPAVSVNPLAGWRVWGLFDWVCVPGALVAVRTMAPDKVHLAVRVRGVTHPVTAAVRGECVPLPGTPAVFQADGAYPMGPNPFCVCRVLFAEGDPAHPLPEVPPGPRCVLCGESVAATLATCGRPKLCPPDHAAALLDYERWLQSLWELIR